MVEIITSLSFKNVYNLIFCLLSLHVWNPIVGRILIFMVRVGREVVLLILVEVVVVLSIVNLQTFET